jgi:hypothetical protein
MQIRIKRQPVHFVKEVAGKGVEWLIQLVGSHSPTVQAQVDPRAANSSTDPTTIDDRIHRYPLQ